MFGIVSNIIPGEEKNPTVQKEVKDSRAGKTNVSYANLQMMRL